MKLYLLSLGAGILAGVLYGLLDVRSPAPPVIALIGLLGILLGEQAVPLARRVFAGDPTVLGAVTSQTIDHLFGHLPGHGAKPQPKPNALAAAPIQKETRDE